LDGHIEFILGSSHEDDPQRVGHKMVAMATGPLNLQFMASYFENENIYKLPNWYVYSSRPPDHMIQFLGK